MATVFTMSETRAPRLRSLIGLFKPCSTGPIATAPALRCTADELIAAGPVIPVIVIDHVDQAVPMARALLAGGVGLLLPGAAMAAPIMPPRQ